MAERLKLLVVEDDPGDITLLKRHLSGFVDYKIAGRLDKALEEMGQDSFDVVLTDLFLPDSEGLATFRALHQRSEDTPIVIMSVLDVEQIAVDAVRQGAQDYLVKGKVDTDVLLRIMRYAIERKKTENTLRQNNSELEHMNKLMMDREERILELKSEVNQILGSFGKDSRYHF